MKAAAAVAVAVMPRTPHHSTLPHSTLPYRVSPLQTQVAGVTVAEARAMKAAAAVVAVAMVVPAAMMWGEVLVVMKEGGSGRGARTGATSDQQVWFASSVWWWCFDRGTACAYMHTPQHSSCVCARGGGG